MKTIITLLICISLATAQQIPNAITSNAKNKLEFKTVIANWREKLKQFNTPELRKSQKYAELRQKMRKELQDIQHGKTTEPAQVTPLQSEKKAEVTNDIQPFGMQTKNVTQIDTLQQHKPPSTAIITKVDEATTCYDVPFASKGNVIELSVANISEISVKGVKVEVTNAPEWLKFQTQQVGIKKLNAKEEKDVSFVFSVDKSAEVNKEQTLSFTITEKSGQQWKKEIKIRIAPPENYELYQNYPNPFNPTTTIEYLLPGVGTRFIVSLKVYDLLGREVANLVDEPQEVGYHRATFDAHRLSSGTYVYQLLATDEQNNQHVFRKKMTFLR